MEVLLAFSGTQDYGFGGRLALISSRNHDLEQGKRAGPAILGASSVGVLGWRALLVSGFFLKTVAGLTSSCVPIFQKNTPL